MVMAGAISQNPDYHLFADTRALRGIPNAMDVLSSGAFFAVGAVGFLITLKRRTGNPSSFAYLLMFSGVFLTGASAIWYHLQPDNDRIVWYRLTGTVPVVALFSAVFSERVNARGGRLLLLPAVFFSVLAIAFWVLSESWGRGDLRPYGFVRVLAVVLTPTIVALYWENSWKGGYCILIWFVCYCLTLICENQDNSIYSFGYIVSGHTLKHLFSAGAYGIIAHMLLSRR